MESREPLELRPLGEEPAPGAPPPDPWRPRIRVTPVMEPGWANLLGAGLGAIAVVLIVASALRGLATLMETIQTALLAPVILLGSPFVALYAALLGLGLWRIRDRWEGSRALRYALAPILLQLLAHVTLLVLGMWGSPEPWAVTISGWLALVGPLLAVAPAITGRRWGLLATGQIYGAALALIAAS
jgi:hypothetical protein